VARLILIANNYDITSVALPTMTRGMLHVASLLDALPLIHFTICKREESVVPVSLVQSHPVFTLHMPYFLLTAFHDEAAVELLATNWFISFSGIRLMSTRFQ
jgi:hypothetical protein